MIDFGPNPPTRREEDFPKTTTIPEGWSTEHITSGMSNSPEANQSEAVENHRPAPVVEDESLFRRQLEPFPKPNTIPGGWDMSNL